MIDLSDDLIGEVFKFLGNRHFLLIAKNAAKYGNSQVLKYVILVPTTWQLEIRPDFLLRCGNTGKPISKIRIRGFVVCVMQS